MKSWVLFGLLLSTFCLSCHRGRPARKELPDSFNSAFDDQTPSFGFPKTTSDFLTGDIFFYSSDTAITLNGLTRNFLVIAMPDPAHDSTVLSMIRAGREMASYLITQLHQENKTGVVIDLRRSYDSRTNRQDYLVKGAATKEQKLPVIFLWDPGSAGRAAAFMSELEQFPAITLSTSSNKLQYEQDCFQDTHPDF